MSLYIVSRDMEGVHRTGPVHAAADYSKTLLQALCDDESEDLVGSVTRVQLLLTTVVERVHDAVYVLPRFARDKFTGEPVSGPPPDAEEYANDVAMAIKALKKYAQELPDDFAEREIVGEARLRELKEENHRQLELAREYEVRIKQVLENRLG